MFQKNIFKKDEKKPNLWRGKLNETQPHISDL